jgi:hypothetical protein
MYELSVMIIAIIFAVGILEGCKLILLYQSEINTRKCGINRI